MEKRKVDFLRIIFLGLPEMENWFFRNNFSKDEKLDFLEKVF